MQDSGPVDPRPHRIAWLIQRHIDTLNELEQAIKRPVEALKQDCDTLKRYPDSHTVTRDITESSSRNYTETNSQNYTEGTSRSYSEGTSWGYSEEGNTSSYSIRERILIVLLTKALQSLSEEDLHQLEVELGIASMSGDAP